MSEQLKISNPLGKMLITLFSPILTPYHGDPMFINISDSLILSLTVMLSSVFLLIPSEEKSVLIISSCQKKFSTGTLVMENSPLSTHSLLSMLTTDSVKT